MLTVSINWSWRMLDVDFFRLQHQSLRRNLKPQVMHPSARPALIDQAKRRVERAVGQRGPTLCRVIRDSQSSKRMAPASPAPVICPARRS